MSLKRRQFTKEFKLQVVRDVEAGNSVAQAAREHHLHPNTIVKWVHQFADDFGLLGWSLNRRAAYYVSSIEPEELKRPAQFRLGTEVRDEQDCNQQ